VDRSVPSDVRALLHGRVDSFEKLEALLLVRADPSKRWTAATVAAQLGLRETWSDPALESLCASGLLLGHGEGTARQFSYRPASAALEAAVTSLAEIYGERRTEIIRLLSNKAMSRIRRAAVRAFGIGSSSRSRRPRSVSPGDTKSPRRERAEPERVLDKPS
jgi:hypothetical protein